MTKTKLSTVQRLARQVKRKQIIHELFGPHRNRGPLGATLAFETDGDDEFQTKVLKGMEAVSTKVKTIEDKQAEILKAMPGDLKGTLEAIEKLKKTANDTAANYDTILGKVNLFQGQLQRHVRGGFENPIQRIQADEELRTRFNLAIRQAINGPNNDLGGLIRASREKLTAVLGKALGEDTSPGSTVIDDRLAAEIYDTLSTFGVWNTFATRNLGTKQTKYPVKTARPIANFILTEAGTIADDTAKAGTSVTLEVELIAALLNVSLQLIQDAEIDVTADVMLDFGEAYANRLDVACLTADGTADATNGGMTGVFVGGTAANAAAGNSTTETTDIEDWTRAILTVDPIVITRAAKWWIHPQHLIRALSVKDANGRPIFLTALEAPAPRSIGSILGYPVVPCFAAPTANVATTKVAVFGDPDGLVVGLRRDYTFEASDHHRWNTFERSFRGTGRAGTKIRRALAFAMLTLTA